MKLLQQILFWMFATFALVLVFGSQYGGYINSFYFVSFLLPVIIGTSYMFSDVLIPNYLLKKNYFKFLLYTLYTIIVSLNLEMIVITLAFAVLANYHFDQMIPASQNVFTLAITMYFVVLIKAFVLLIKNSNQKEEEISTFEEREQNMQRGYLLVRVDRKNAKLLFDDILYIESLSDYVKIFIKDKSPIITKKKISSIDTNLSKPFLRIHRSFIINTDAIESFSKEAVEISSREIPISRTYKKEALDYLQNNSARL